jgi:hypothetical protein
VALLAVLGVLLIAAVASAGGDGGGGQAATATTLPATFPTFFTTAPDTTVEEIVTTEPEPPTTTTPRPPKSLRLPFTLKGRGTMQLPPFTAAGSWRLAWSYDCRKAEFSTGFDLQVEPGGERC